MCVCVVVVVVAAAAAAAAAAACVAVHEFVLTLFGFCAPMWRNSTLLLLLIFGMIFLTEEGC